jgi:excisionase family DNA binding protein
MEKQFYRVQEVAEIIGLGKSMTYKLVLEGHIPSIHLAGCRARRVPKQALDKWIADQSAQATGGDSSY